MVLTVYGDIELYREFAVLGALDLDPQLRLAAADIRTNPKIGDMQPLANLDTDIRIQSHAGLTVMPADCGIVPAGTGSGIHLLALIGNAVLPLAAHKYMVVFKLNTKLIKSRIYIIGYLELKW